ncbi:MAG: hypothetical protein KDK70_15195, partial [Myxococcales bacterium]|nr:hypothetical protein [Myxococcales bacterium]
MLSGDRLEVEAAVVPSGTAQPHGQPLARWSAARRALQGRRPARLAELGGREGDAPPRGLDLPDGSACAMIPLFQAEDDLGLVAIARRSGEA